MPVVISNRFGVILLKCHDCGKDAVRTVPCEEHNPKGAMICKDCCIKNQKGHKCPWWDMCWRDKTVNKA